MLQPHISSAEEEEEWLKNTITQAKQAYGQTSSVHIKTLRK